MPGYFPMLALESYWIVRDLERDSNNRWTEISIRPHIQHYALNTAFLHVDSAISLLRSASENCQDYIPALRFLPANKNNASSKELRGRRDAYLNLLLDKVVMIEKGTDKPCISAAILKDQETKLTRIEVSSICLSLVSGGFKTIPSTFHKEACFSPLASLGDVHFCTSR